MTAGQVFILGPEATVEYICGEKRIPRKLKKSVKKKGTTLIVHGDIRKLGDKL